MIYCSGVTFFDGSYTRDEECCMSFDADVADCTIKTRDGDVLVMLNDLDGEKPTLLVVCQEVSFGDEAPYWW